MFWSHKTFQFTLNMAKSKKNRRILTEQAYIHKLVQLYHKINYTVVQKLFLLVLSCIYH